jgi:hypothetical protein
VYAIVARRYKTLPTGTGFRKVQGSALMKVCGKVRRGMACHVSIYPARVSVN